MNARRNKKPGFTLIELLVVMAIIALLLGILLPALNKARSKARQVKSATQLSQIHKGLVTFASDEDGIFPTPGRIARLQYNGNFVPGKGEEDYQANNHANMYSAMIQRNFVSPQILICPAEVNSRCVVDADYNYEEYRPLQGQYWDMNAESQGELDPEGDWNTSGFASNLGDECNVSYATMALVGKRKKDQWRDGMDSSFVVIGTRGPGDNSSGTTYSVGGLDGSTPDISLYEQSQTIGIFGGREEHFGNQCFNDGHIEYNNTFTPDGHKRWEDSSGEYFEDDIYVNEDLTPSSNNPNNVGKDAFICMIYAIENNSPDDGWDPTGYTAVWD